MFLNFEKILKIIIKLKVYNKTHFVSKNNETQKYYYPLILNANFQGEYILFLKTFYKWAKK